MTEAEIAEFTRLLKQYGEEALDQWDLWKFDTRYGRVYVSISREPLSGPQLGDDDRHYDLIIEK